MKEVEKQPINKIVMCIQEGLGADAVPEFLKVLSIAESVVGELDEDTVAKICWYESFKL